jgi:hypothetical protein
VPTAVRERRRQRRVQRLVRRRGKSSTSRESRHNDDSQTTRIAAITRPTSGAPIRMNTNNASRQPRRPRVFHAYQGTNMALVNHSNNPRSKTPPTPVRCVSLSSHKVTAKDGARRKNVAAVGDGGTPTSAYILRRTARRLEPNENGQWQHSRSVHAPLPSSSSNNISTHLFDIRYRTDRWCVRSILVVRRHSCLHSQARFTRTRSQTMRSVGHCLIEGSQVGG